MSLPTWSANVGYEEGEAWVMSKLVTGYPRFFIHNSIKAFAAAVAERFGRPGQTAMLFPSRAAAARCLAFVDKYAAPPSVLDGMAVVHLALDPANPEADLVRPLAPTISAVLLHPDAFPFAKQYWQHSGDGVSSRRGEFCHRLFTAGLLVRQPDDAAAAPAASEAAAAAAAAPAVAMKPFRGPKRYRQPMSPTRGVDASPVLAPAPVPCAKTATPPPANGRPVSPGDGGDDDADETARFLEERFGRNLDLSFVRRAKSAIRRRITGALTADNDVDLEHCGAATPSLTAPGASNASSGEGNGTADTNLRGVSTVDEDDVYLMPCGMNAIFNAHRFLLRAYPERAHLKSINFGFPYVDTLKILEKFGAGCLFYGHASEADLDDLERRLQGGEQFLALFCEFPGNPLLTCPNLGRIRQLANTYDFAVVVDETIGTFANVNVMPFADVVVSSLTKIFSGDCNVMGGSLVLNRQLAREHPIYVRLKAAAAAEYDANGFWPEDVIFMERNSRDFATRVDRINANAEAICEVLRASPLVAQLYYPKYGASRANYEACRVGGYGGLLSFSFQRKAQAIAFYDALDTAKGPSLGTNFTLTSPYVVLAHYQELDWCAELGVNPDLLRISVGLEETGALRQCIETALAAAAAV